MNKNKLPALCKIALPNLSLYINKSGFSLNKFPNPNLDTPLSISKLF